MIFKPENRRRDDILISFIIVFSFVLFIVGVLLYDGLVFMNHESPPDNLVVGQVYIQIVQHSLWVFFFLFVLFWIVGIYFKKFFCRFCCRYPRFYFVIISAPIVIIYWFLTFVPIYIIEKLDLDVGFQRIIVMLPIMFVMWQLMTFWIVKRRLHDFGFSAGWTILYAIPILSILLHIFLCLKPGTIGDNKYGPDPLQMAKN